MGVIERDNDIPWREGVSRSGEMRRVFIPSNAIFKYLEITRFAVPKDVTTDFVLGVLHSRNVIFNLLQHVRDRLKLAPSLRGS